MRFASSGQEEAEGRGGLSLGKERWEVGCACNGGGPGKVDRVAMMMLRKKRWRDGECLDKQKKQIECVIIIEA